MPTSPEKHMYNEGLGDLAKAQERLQMAKIKVQTSGLGASFEDSHWERLDRAVSEIAEIRAEVQQTDRRVQEYARQIERGTYGNDHTAPSSPAPRSGVTPADVMASVQRKLA